MTSEQFRKKSYRCTTLIEYTIPQSNKMVICSLCEVDFDEEILTICPIDGDRYNQHTMQVNIKHCEIHDPKIIKLNKEIL